MTSARILLCGVFLSSVLGCGQTTNDDDASGGQSSTDGSAGGGTTATGGSSTGGSAGGAPCDDLQNQAALDFAADFGPTQKCEVDDDCALQSVNVENACVGQCGVLVGTTGTAGLKPAIERACSEFWDQECVVSHHPCLVTASFYCNVGTCAAKPLE